MDFDWRMIEGRGYGRYEFLDPSKSPSLYVAYRCELSEGTEVFHNDLRSRWNQGDPRVVEAMKKWAELTRDFREAMDRGDLGAMRRPINANFDLRASLYDVGDGNRALVSQARSFCVSAKFSGSGGAIVGICQDDTVFERMKEVFALDGVEVIRPQLAPELPENGG